MVSLHQFIPVLDPSDAASNHTLQVQRLLLDKGLESTIFTEQTHRSLQGMTRPYRSWTSGAAMYQFAIGSQMADWLGQASMPLSINHHNVTPARFFEAPIQGPLPEDLNFIA